MQRSLPLANQPRDPLTGKRAEHYLSGVPIGLLPLLEASDDSAPTSEGIDTPSPVASPRPSSPTFPSINCDTVEFAPVSGWNMTFHRSSSHTPSPPSTYKASPHLVHLLPSRLRPNRQKPRFPFLPLLDTPSSSESSSPYPSNAPSRTPSPSHAEHDHDGDLASDTDQSFDPPTPSLTNASLDSSPHSRASSCSPEPPFLQLPSPNTKPTASHGGGYVIGSNDSYFPPCDLFNNIPDIPSRFHQIAPRDHSRAAMTRPQAMPNPITLIPPSALTLPQVNAPKAKKRNIIVVNDVEIELDDEEEEPQATTESTSTSTTGTISPVNGIDERAATPTIEDVALSETKPNLDVLSDNIATGVSSVPPPLRTPTSSFKPPSTGTVLVSPPRYPGSHRSKTHGSYHCHAHPSSSSPLPLSSPSPTSDPSSPAMMNESVNLHIPIFFKRGMQSTSYGVNRSASH